MLKKDQDDFMKYQEQNKTAMIEAENRADKVSKEKKDRENQIKDLHLKLTSLKVEKTRNEEALSNYQDHKAFLDKLAPSVPDLFRDSFCYATTPQRLPGPAPPIIFLEGSAAATFRRITPLRVSVSVRVREEGEGVSGLSN